MVSIGFCCVFFFTGSGEEVVTGAFGDEGRVARRHDGRVRVGVVAGDVARVVVLGLVVRADLAHQLQHLPIAKTNKQTNKTDVNKTQREDGGHRCSSASKQQWKG